MKNTTSDESYNRFLNPDELRPNLIFAAIFITSYEMLEDVIIDRIKNFFTFGREKDKSAQDTYQKEVLDKGETILQASIIWLKENKVINEEDHKLFRSVRKARAKLAHELLKRITEDDMSVYNKELQDIIYLIDKIEKWWIIEFEIPCNPDYDHQEIDVDQVQSGLTLAIQAMIDIALGDDDTAKKYYEEWIRLTGTEH